MHIALELDEGRGLAGHNIKRQTGPKKVFRLSFMLKGGERKLFTTTVPYLVTPKISIPKHDGGIPHKAKKKAQYQRTIYKPLSFFFWVSSVHSRKILILLTLDLRSFWEFRGLLDTHRCLKVSDFFSKAVLSLQHKSPCIYIVKYTFLWTTDV